MTKFILWCGVALAAALVSAQEPRPRAREIGLAPGVFEPGTKNAITDVAGVSVGHATLNQGDAIRTGVTVIVPHQGNVFQDKVPGAVFVGNAFGKLCRSRRSTSSARSKPADRPHQHAASVRDGSLVRGRSINRATTACDP